MIDAHRRTQLPGMSIRCVPGACGEATHPCTGGEWLWFTVVPLVVMGAVALSSLVITEPCIRSLEPLPWLVALLVVGLPHGAADLEVHRVGGGRRAVWNMLLCSVFGIVATLAGLVLTPLATLAGFLIVSLWHFGHADELAGIPSQRVGDALAATLARGGIVIGGALAAWPGSSAGVAGELIDVLAPARTACGLAPLASPRDLSGPIARAGLLMLVVAVVCWGWELAAALRRPPADIRRQGTMQDLVSFLVVGLLVAATPPLLATGVFFLVWHAWRQYPRIAFLLGMPGSGAHPIYHVIQVHRAALPLLVPAWILLAAVWWCGAGDHSARSLALMSLLLYAVVTPTHEIVRPSAEGRGGTAITTPADPNGARACHRPSAAGMMTSSGPVEPLGTCHVRAPGAASKHLVLGICPAAHGGLYR